MLHWPRPLRSPRRVCPARWASPAGIRAAALLGTFGAFLLTAGCGSLVPPRIDIKSARPQPGLKELLRAGPHRSSCPGLPRTQLHLLAGPRNTVQGPQLFSILVQATVTSHEVTAESFYWTFKGVHETLLEGDSMVASGPQIVCPKQLASSLQYQALASSPFSGLCFLPLPLASNVPAPWASLGSLIHP